MNKISLALILTGLVVSAADAAPRYLTRDGRGGYKVTYNYVDKEKSGWYGTIRAQLNFVNLDYDYFSDDVGVWGKDKYSLKPVFGGSLAVGKKFGSAWRSDLEIGYSGMFKDREAGAEVSLYTPYALANIYRDFNGGLYLGLGAGGALPSVSLDYDILIGSRSSTAIAPMGGFMFGFARKLDDNLAVDLRIRAAGWTGVKQTRNYQDINNNQYTLDTKIDWVLENSFSLGIRYEF